MEVIEILESSDIFGGFEKGYLEKIVSLCHSQQYSKGEIIFEEGSESKELYILTDGSLALEKKVRQASEGQTWATILEDIGNGEAFGWSAMVEPHIFTSSVRCLTDCEVLAINAEKLRELMESDSNLGYEIAKRLARLISSRMTYARASLTSSLGQARLAKEIGATGE